MKNYKITLPADLTIDRLIDAVDTGRYHVDEHVFKMNIREDERDISLTLSRLVVMLMEAEEV